MKTIETSPRAFKTLLRALLGQNQAIEIREYIVHQSIEH